ncbi:MAG: class I SAM-dependent methyltransferase [Acidobacteria bacterium]|nr:class I SAM-dependent methyltransferase [Acidobacteriota bacterium]
MSQFYDLVRREAEIKFGKKNEPAIAKWVGYWTDTLSRNFELVRMFRTRTEINFSGKTVLDIGCGTGGLSENVTGEGGYYIGSDFFPKILEMAQAFVSELPHSEKAALVRASGISLPLADHSVDIVVAFDVIEHLEEGWNWQRSFLQEIRRVLRRKGILILTTPNRLYPWEGHTFMYGPQYLPVCLADRYIKWKNPSFLQEYRTYGQVKLLNPWQMRKLLDQAGLRVIHDFPWGMDLEDYPRTKRLVLRLLSKFGLGWAPTSAFWFSAGRAEDREEMRALRKKEWLRG